MQAVFDRIAWIVTTVGGVGFCPFAPGTVGSLVPTLAVLATRKSPCLRGGILLVLLEMLIISVPSIQTVLKEVTVKAKGQPLSKKLIDPSFVVLDEVIGQLLTFVTVSCAYPLSSLTVGLCFLAFRFFDILKPWPICAVERALERLPRFRALSIILDDVLAGLFAAASVVIGYALFL